MVARADAPIVKKQSGRPRDAHVDRAVLEAAGELLAEKGYTATSIETIARRAGVGKTTIYRRWRSKEELVVDLLSQVAAEVEPVPDLGDTRAELLRLVTEAIGHLTRAPVGGIIQGLASELSRKPTLGRLVRERVIRLRRAEVRKVLERGIARGALRADTDTEIAHELLIGPAYYHLLLGDRLDRRFAARIVDAFLRGAAA
jgi:AcrR family transcriptional regulator